ncbi:MAG: M42 family metallopeptidase [Candidatus Lokiarchaeota archaeon]|nr:M42 family metallopeptidase [Candidatus Lokiarchaeota archaeon]
MTEFKLDLKLLENLSNAFGPSGYETEAQKIALEYGKLYADAVEFDRTGSVIFKKGSSGPKIMLAGHGDEIGFIVCGIEKSGYLRINNLGGWWSHSVLSQQVLIRTMDGKKIIGIIIAPPPHILPPDKRDKVIPLEKMYMDVGCKSEKEVKELGINIGDPVVPVSTFRIEKRTRISIKDNKKKEEVQLAIGKAFDDRIGVFIILEVLRRLKQEEIDHPNIVYCAATTQEEVGLRGARTAAKLIEPDIGFSLDVDVSGDIPGVQDISQKMGEGVAISAGDGSMIPNPRFRKFVIDIAEKHKIKWQPAFLRRGGTDAGVIHLTGIGAPSLFIGIPTRHIHTHNGILDLSDVENAIKLLVEVIKELNEKTVESFTKLE